MKTKLSVTLEEALVTFLDTEPGVTRSEKIEVIIRRYRTAREDLTLREQLAAFSASAENAEADAWRRTMEDDQWGESGAGTSGRSRSSRSRSRGRP